MPKTDLDDNDQLIRAIQKDLNRILAEEGESVRTLNRREPEEQ